MGKLIDIGAAMGGKMFKVPKDAQDVVMEIIQVLVEAPDAVVRCKDCLWGKWNQALWDSIYCENIGMDRDLYDYCSRGERREDGNT